MKLRFKSYHGTEYTSDKIISTLTHEQLKSAITLIARKCLEEPHQENYDHNLILNKLTAQLEKITSETLKAR